MSNTERSIDDTKRKKSTTGKIKPDIRQPNIKLFAQRKVHTLSSPQTEDSANSATQVLTPTSKENFTVYNRKKRSPPSPSDQQQPSKKTNMSNHEDDLLTPNGSSEDQETKEEHDTIKQEDPVPELQDLQLIQLRRLLNEDMAKMIAPLKERVNSIEKSNKLLDEKGEMITSMKIENDKLRIDCKKVKMENKRLKERICAIENKLLENNIIVQGIPDQPWELSDNLREKTLIAISHLANGKTPQEKLNIVRKIGIKNVKRVGDYTSKRIHPVSIEFVNKASANFLYENKRKLPKGLYVNREYNVDIERNAGS